MKKFVFIAASALAVLPAFTNANGPSNARSGSPMSNGQTCTSCHSGASIANQTLTITTGIPTDGYVDNSNYTITVTSNLNGASNPKVGFQASVEGSGMHQGSLSAGTGTKLVNNNHFVTHTISSNTPSNQTKSWSFTWNSGTAPDGTTVYASGLFANGNNSDNGDATLTATLPLTRSHLGTDEPSTPVFRAQPNPARDVLSLELTSAQTASVLVYSIQGHLVASKMLTGSETWDVSSWPNGSYILTYSVVGETPIRQLITVAH